MKSLNENPSNQLATSIYPCMNQWGRMGRHRMGKMWRERSEDQARGLGDEVLQVIIIMIIISNIM